jgi:hypothetical protein
MGQDQAIFLDAAVEGGAASLKYYKYEEAVKAGLRSKTEWDKLGRKLKEDAVPAGYRRGEYVKEVLLYPESETVPKRVRVERPAQPLEPTPENIGLALFEVNRAAKRRRDAAQKSYTFGAFSFATAHKSHKEKLYDLKDKVLQKALAEGIAKLVGLHFKKRTVEKWVYEDVDCHCDCDIYEDWNDFFVEEICDCPCHSRKKVLQVSQVTDALACFELAGYRFHSPVSNEEAERLKEHVHEIVDLGAWTAAAKPPTGRIRIKDAIATLEAYLAS